MLEGSKTRILFLCTGISCRSQMAEGWAKHLKSERLEAYSAGIETHGLNPSAVKVMKEVGVDISGHRSKNVEELLGIPFDFVITVCGHAQEICPVFLGDVKQQLHIGFEDPVEAMGTEEVVLNVFRKVRDQINHEFYNFYNEKLK